MQEPPQVRISRLRASETAKNKGYSETFLCKGSTGRTF
jgi:hypothetical protein